MHLCQCRAILRISELLFSIYVRVAIRCLCYERLCFSHLCWLLCDRDLNLLGLVALIRTKRLNLAIGQTFDKINPLVLRVILDESLVWYVIYFLKVVVTSFSTLIVWVYFYASSRRNKKVKTCFVDVSYIV